MAKYVRLYTYTGQENFTSGEQLISLSDFTVSGEVTAPIRDISQISVYHWHKPLGRDSYTATAKFNLKTGGSVNANTSNTIEVSANNAVKFSNHFTSITVPQFENISTLQISISGDHEVQWIANEARPLQIYVYYSDVAPDYYFPEIQRFDVKRGDSVGTETDRGTKMLLTAKLSLAHGTTYAPICKLKLYYSSGTVSTASDSIDLSNYVSTFLSGVTDSPDYISGVFADDSDYNFLLVFECDYEKREATTTVSNSFVSLHISPCSTGGVSIGDLSTSTEGNPKFEVHHPSTFYDQIVNIQVGVIDQMGFPTEGGAYSEKSVSFPTPYVEGTVPVVVIGFVNTSVAGNFGRCCVAVSEVNHTGFKFRFHNGDTSNRNPKFSYIAFGIPGMSMGDVGGGDSGDSGGTGGGSTTGSSVTVNPNYTTGLNIATITVNDTPYDIYVPTSNAIDTSDTTKLATAYAVNLLNQKIETAIKTLSFSAGKLTPTTVGNTALSAVTMYKYGTSLPSSGTTGDLFFLI